MGLLHAKKGFGSLVRSVSVIVALGGALSTAANAYTESIYPQVTLSTADIFQWITNPYDQTANEQEKPMVKHLRSIMSQATSSLDLAFYGVEKQDWFFEEIKKAKRRGVKVRMIVDQERGSVESLDRSNFNYPDTVELFRILNHREITVDLNENGTSRNHTIMHNKFIVADKRVVWFGSTNLSPSGIGNEYSANDALTVESKALAGLFLKQFEMMFSGQFSIHKDPTPGDRVVAFRDRSEWEVFFSPKDQPREDGIMPFIEGARNTLDIGMFFLTDDQVSQAIIDAVRRRVKVRLIIDAVAAAHPSSTISELRRAGVLVKVENWGGKMHMKTAIRDGAHVAIGSVNWTKAGFDENDEHLVIVRNHRDTTIGLERYFQKLWDSLPDECLNRTMPAESVHSPGSCHDGIDNDFNGLIDRADPRCRTSSAP